MLKVKKLDPRAKLPTVAHVGEDLGYDLFALENTVLKYGVVTKVRTGIAAQAFEETRTIHDTGFRDARVAPSEVVRVRYKPLGLLIRDRSSMAAKGIVVSGGVIDHGYTGEISVLMTNWSEASIVYILNKSGTVRIQDVRPGQIIPCDFPNSAAVFKEYTIQAGDKIAQMVPLPVLTGNVIEVEELDAGSRGSDGFGSTGE